MRETNIIVAGLALCMLAACHQQPPKTDWLENAPKNNSSIADNPAVSNVGSTHSHSGPR